MGMENNWKTRDEATGRLAYPVAIEVLQRLYKTDGPIMVASDHDDWEHATDLRSLGGLFRAQVRCLNGLGWAGVPTIHTCRPCSAHGDFEKGLRCSQGGHHHANEWVKMRADGVDRLFAAVVEGDVVVWWAVIDVPKLYAHYDECGQRTEQSWMSGFRRAKKTDQTPFVKIRIHDPITGEKLPWLVEEWYR
jgi:hypothetical protein